MVAEEMIGEEEEEASAWIIIIVIIIAFKGTVRDFLQSPRCTANCLQHVRSSGQDTIM